MEEIAQALGISHGSVSTILHDCLGMRRLTACWVPKSLSDEQMATRASVCSALLKRFRSKDDFLLHLVTVDETWVHYYEPENKAQSRQGRAWVPKAKEVQDASICWQGDGHSILGRKRHYYGRVLSRILKIGVKCCCPEKVGVLPYFSIETFQKVGVRNEKLE